MVSEREKEDFEEINISKSTTPRTLYNDPPGSLLGDMKMPKPQPIVQKYTYPSKFCRVC